MCERLRQGRRDDGSLNCCVHKVVRYIYFNLLRVATVYTANLKQCGKSTGLTQQHFGGML